MNAPTKSITGDIEIDLNVSAFHHLRSAMLDCCAVVEEALTGFLAENHPKPPAKNAPSGQKVERAKEVKANSKRSKTIKKQTDEALALWGALLAKRADIVHSRMSIAVTMEGQFIALFRNAKNAGQSYAQSLVLSEREFEDFVNELRSAGNNLVVALSATNPPPAQKAKAA